ncbi:MAG TPA: hypothetical protein VIY90_00110 [Steroidobacteraceae bacterium]
MNQPIEEAERAGFDLSLVEESLGYSYEQRALYHQAALNLALEMEDAGRRMRDSRPTRQSPNHLVRSSVLGNRAPKVQVHQCAALDRSRQKEKRPIPTSRILALP